MSQRGSWDLLKQVWEAEVDSSAERLVLLNLARRADNQTWTCWPSQTKIATDCCLSERTVRTVLSVLEKRGLIHRTSRFNKGRKTSDRIALFPPQSPAEDSRQAPAANAASPALSAGDEAGSSIPQVDRETLAAAIAGDNRQDLPVEPGSSCRVTNSFEPTRQNQNRSGDKGGLFIETDLPRPGNKRAFQVEAAAALIKELTGRLDRLDQGAQGIQSLKRVSGWLERYCADCIAAIVIETALRAESPIMGWSYFEEELARQTKDRPQEALEDRGGVWKERADAARAQAVAAETTC